jgi:FkbH-like protein
MVRAQLTRESQRKAMSRDQFLLDAAPTVSIIRIDGTGHARFARVRELVNKTNQFNTTGRRWRTEEFADHFRAGGQIIAFEVTDRFTSYGLVGVVIFREGRIEQWVMSCRVLGYQIEEAVMAAIIEPMRAAGTTTVYGRLIHTDVNFPCRELFSRCGFVDMNGDGDWALATGTGVAIPAHVTIT